MHQIIQGQRNWADFKTNNNVGIITTLFSEQYLSTSYNIFNLTLNDYQEEINSNEIDTIFIDNDLFESDHEWYKKNRGHLINYFKKTDINICVIRNTKKEVSQLFKRAFIIEIDYKLKDYQYSELILKSPILLNDKYFNPIDTSIEKDIVSFNSKKHDSLLESKNYNKYKVESINFDKISRKNLESLFDLIKNCKILYLNYLNGIDEITLKYIEYIALLNSTYVVYSHKYNLDNDDFIVDDVNSLNNKLSILLRNPDYLFRNILSLQRGVFLNNTILLKQEFHEFIIEKKVKRKQPKISVITSSNRKHNLRAYFEQLSAQKHVYLEVNLVTHGFQLSENEKHELIKDLDFHVNFQAKSFDHTLGACLNFAIDTSSYPIVTKVDDDDLYTENYMIDQWLALSYSRADLVGKATCYYYFESENIIGRRNVDNVYKFNNFVSGATFMCSSFIIKKIKFDKLSKSEDTNFIKKLIDLNGSIYSGHPYEFCVYRSENTAAHTWKVSDIVMLKNTDIVGYGNPIDYVTLQ